MLIYYRLNTTVLPTILLLCSSESDSSEKYSISAVLTILL